MEDLVAFRFHIDLVTSRSSERAPTVLRIAVLLTADRFVLESAQESPLQSVPRARRDSELQRIAQRFADEITGGQIATSSTFGLETCLGLWGDACVNEAGVFEPVAIEESLRDQFGGTISRSFVSETQVLLRHPSGVVIQLTTQWRTRKRTRPPVPESPLTIRALSRWAPPPPQSYPAKHDDPAWSRWCAHDWPRLQEPQRDLSSRCLLQLLSDAYDSPIKGGRIADMMMLDFDPMPPPDEARIDTVKLDAIERHLSHRCTEVDTSACGRVLESIDSARRRKTSLFENVVLGEFTALLRTVLAGEPLPDDMLVQGRSRWSELTLDKLTAAIWARNGYRVVPPDLADFFYGSRAPGSLGADLLPLPWPDSRFTSLSSIDRENLARIQRIRR